MGVSEVEDGLDKGLMDLKGHGTSKNDLLHPSVDPEGGLVGKQELSSHRQTVHSYQHPAPKTS